MAAEDSKGSFFRDITAYLLFLMLVSTLGPLQFGYHIVRNCSL